MTLLIQVWLVSMVGLIAFIVLRDALRSRDSSGVKR